MTILLITLAGYAVVLIGGLMVYHKWDMRKFEKKMAREQEELQLRSEARLEMIMNEGRDLIRKRRERELLQKERMNQYLEGKR